MKKKKGLIPSYDDVTLKMTGNDIAYALFDMAREKLGDVHIDDIRITIDDIELSFEDFETEVEVFIEYNRMVEDK